jgi:hypothetical protein
MDADTLNTLGRITGLVSANLLLYQVLLMARVPLFERAFGRDAITRMHRWVGFWSFWLLLAHIALLVVGYAAQAGVNVIAQLWDFVWNYPGMMLATAGTGLLVLVVVTSIRRARRAMRYESWHLLPVRVPRCRAGDSAHAVDRRRFRRPSARRGVLVGTVGGDRRRGHRLPRGAAAVALRASRHPRRRRRGRRAGGRRGPHARTRLGAPRRPRRSVLRLAVSGRAGWTRGVPLSLAADPRRGELVVAARMVGDGTRRLATLRRGTRVLIEGPYGEFTGEARTRRGSS